jgi:hypothetical protein
MKIELDLPDNTAANCLRIALKTKTVGASREILLTNHIRKALAIIEVLSTLANDAGEVSIRDHGTNKMEKFSLHFNE